MSPPNSGRVGQATQGFKGYPEGLKAINPHLETLDVPVQVFWGDKDAFLTTDNAEKYWLFSGRA